MNKLIERLQAWGEVLRANPDHNVGTLASDIEKSVKALEAADRMAEVLTWQRNTRAMNGEIPSPRSQKSDAALAAYRNLTQEAPHAG